MCTPVRWFFKPTAVCAGWRYMGRFIRFAGLTGHWCARSVHVSVRVFCTPVSPAETAEPIEMPFGEQTPVSLVRAQGTIC